MTGSNLKFNKLITCSGESGRLRIDLPNISDQDIADMPEMPKWLDRLPLSYLGLWGKLNQLGNTKSRDMPSRLRH